MGEIITFIIPIIHQNNATNWGSTIANLTSSNGEVIEKVAGKEAHKNYMSMRADDVPATFADIDSLKEEVIFKPDTKIEFGMEQFVAWFKDYYKVGNTNK